MHFKMAITVDKWNLELVARKGFQVGVEAAISWETIECEKTGRCGSLLKLGNSKDRHIGCEGTDGLLTNLTQNQVFHRDFLEENTAKDHGNTSAVKLVDASRKRKHGSGSEEKEDKEKLVNVSEKKKRGPLSEKKKEKKKIKYRKNRAEKNRELGVKRLQLQHVQKPKIVSHCRHYLKGRCHEGDKCQFSHDIVPLTKSKPCTHFARHSCMKGDDCPFDHQLSKYPCNNFVSRGSCSRGDACLFSHQVPTNEDIPTPSNVCRPELKSQLLSGNANFSTPLNNHGSSSVQQNHFTNSAGIHSCVNVEHKVTDTVQKHPTPPKGISFINLAKLSPSSSTLKQGTVTTTKGSPVQIGTCEDQSAFAKTQNKVEIPKKLPAVTPKGINFLSFGKGSVCSFKSPIGSNVNRENGSKLPQLFNFGLPERASSSLNKDDYNKASDRTKQNVSLTDIFLNEILEKNKSMAEGMKSMFPEKTSVDVSMRDHSLSKSVQEGKKPSDHSQSSNVTSVTLRPFVSKQSSERLISGCHKLASNSGQRALLSTLAFAAEHESDIKMKYPTGDSPV
ncbi:Zinc finger CCCH domain-containing protein 65 [Spatholobus suberectus]|nr:Zinc finger CCCH domain-containing protein 65 [Spatholobus suberectus]